MRRISLNLKLPDSKDSGVVATWVPFYIVLYRHQNSDTHGIGFAEFREGGWRNCSEPWQPEVLQYFDPQEGKFKDGRPQID